MEDKETLKHWESPDPEFYEEIGKLQQICYDKDRMLFQEIEPFLDQTYYKVSPVQSPRSHSPNLVLKRKLSRISQRGTPDLKKHDSDYFNNGFKLHLMDHQNKQKEIFIDPGAPPIFIFMPSKAQLEKMILKSLKYKEVSDIY